MKGSLLKFKIKIEEKSQIATVPTHVPLEALYFGAG